MTTIKINTPKYLNFEELFGGMQNAKQNQVKFLIHQINHFTIKEGHLGLYHKAYYQFLGITSKELTTLLVILMDRNIIERLTRGTNNTGLVSKYRIVEPFSIADSNITTYTIGAKGTPKFIAKYVADNYKVKTTEESNFRKVNKVLPMPTKTELLKQQISELQSLVASQQVEMDAMRTLIQSGNIGNQDNLITSIPPSMTVDLVPEAQDPIEAIHVFEYDGEKFSVNCWGELITDSNYERQEIEEEIAEASSYHSFEVNGKEIIKRYDINDHIYTVSIVKTLD